VLIHGGEFHMGSLPDEHGRQAEERQHLVQISAFYLGSYEVRQKEFRAVMGYNPST
jgi:formylglycine-generating enzyme required for sulfatase activity